MSRWLVLVGVAGSLSAPSGSPTESIAALRDQFGPAIMEKATPAPEVWYCPDNTCEMFRGGGGTKSSEVADFALLYLHGVSDYTYLKEWQLRPNPPALDALLARSAGTCKGLSGPGLCSCALRRLVSSRRIQAFFVRYDEGVGELQPLPLGTQLTCGSTEP